MEPVRGPANDNFLHSVSDSRSFPRLLADIGGTNVRFALEQANGQIEAIIVRPLKAFQSIHQATANYLAQPQSIAAGAKHVRLAVFAMANPVHGDTVSMTNADWTFSIEAVRQAIRLSNDC